jgi:cell cycle checkpoint control protein RAD9A
VLVNRLISQLREGNPSEPPHLATSTHGKARDGTGSRGQQCRVNVSEQPSDHTRIWS